MKKTALLLTLFCFVGGSIALASASRYAYHQYQKQSTYRDVYGGSANRYYTRRISPLQYEQRILKSQLYRANLRGKNRINNYKTPTTNRLAYKLARPGLYPRVLNNYQTKKYIIRGPRDYSLAETQINPYQNRDHIKKTKYDNFRITPRSSFSKDKQGTYRAPGTSLAFQVEGYQAQFNCNQNTFAACTTRLTSQFIADQGLRVLVNKSNDFRLNQTQHLDFEFYPSVTESFQAHGNIYFIFTALNPVDHKVVRIEAVAAQGDLEKATIEAFKIFETFRFVDNN